jgi:hypothetical protein
MLAALQNFQSLRDLLAIPYLQNRIVACAHYQYLLSTNVPFPSENPKAIVYHLSIRSQLINSVKQNYQQPPARLQKPTPYTSEDLLKCHLSCAKVMLPILQNPRWSVYSFPLTEKLVT